MARIRIKIDVSGIEEIKHKLGTEAAIRLGDALDLDVGNETRKMAVQGYHNAPVETGALRASILSSVEKVGRMHYHFGSRMIYALRQDYEHKTKRAYLRRAYWDGWDIAAATFTATIKRRLSP